MQVTLPKRINFYANHSSVHCLAAAISLFSDTEPAERRSDDFCWRSATSDSRSCIGVRYRPRLPQVTVVKI